MGLNFKKVKAVFYLFSLTFFYACGFSGVEIPVSNEVPADDGVVFTKDGEKWVTLNLNSMSSLLQDARSIVPDCPDLYFSVTASTQSDSSSQADVSYAASLNPSAFVPHPYYATEKNRMSGLTLTLKVGKSYWFTVYGSQESPADICCASPFFAADYTGYSTTSSFGTLSSTQRSYMNSLGSGIYQNSYTYNSELVYYAFRQKIAELLEAEAIVKGSARYYIALDEDDRIVIHRGADSSGEVCQVISVPVNSTGTSGTGYAFIPVDLGATYSDDPSNTTGAYEVSKSGLSVKRIRFRWTSRLNPSDDGYLDIPVSQLGNTSINSRYNVKFALMPYMRVGTYDTDLILYSQSNSSGYVDCFTIHDTIRVLKNQESVLMGKGSFYTSNVDFTMTYKGSPSSTGENASVSCVTDEGFTYLTYSGKAVNGYKITARNLMNYFRTVFYVSGSGGNLVSCEEDEETGSLLHPYKSIGAAVNAIFNGSYGFANGFGSSSTEWNIIVDGSPEENVQSVINYTATVANNRDFNLVVRNYNGTTSVNMVKPFTITNSSTRDVNVTFTNVTWSNPDFKDFTNSGTGSINVTFN